MKDLVAIPRQLGPRCFSSITPSYDRGEELKLPSATQIAVLTSELCDQQVLLKIASSLNEICCTSMLERTSLLSCLHFRAAVVVVVVSGEGDLFLAQISSISANRMPLLRMSLGQNSCLIILQYVVQLTNIQKVLRILVVLENVYGFTFCRKLVSTQSAYKYFYY